MADKIRLDAAVVAKGIAESREKAKALIMAGNIFIGRERMDKPGVAVPADIGIELKGAGLPYVSRGGLKLEKAMTLFSIQLSGCTCIDIGASTGGFTDCMLQNGAAKVYAVDVGYGQLAWTLRNDSRVINLERTNIRYVTREQVPDPLDFGSIDVSFISLTLVLPVLQSLLKPGGGGLCLVKPQFEAGKGKVGKKGVVRDVAVHLEVCRKIYDFLEKNQLCLLGATFSPIKGPQGNIEYLYYFNNSANPAQVSFAEIEEMVRCSHEMLD